MGVATNEFKEHQEGLLGRDNRELCSSLLSLPGSIGAAVVQDRACAAPPQLSSLPSSVSPVAHHSMSARSDPGKTAVESSAQAGGQSGLLVFCW